MQLGLHPRQREEETDVSDHPVDEVGLLAEGFPSQPDHRVECLQDNPENTTDQGK